MEMLFNLFKVKFTKLDELITKNCHDVTRQSKINVFINLEPIIKKLSAANIDEYLKVKNDERIIEMISCIINLAAHYRLFFSKNKLYSKVYLYMGHPFNAEYKNKNINENYRNAYTEKYCENPKNSVLKNTIDNLIPLLQIILEYVEGVYFVKSDMVESSLIPYVINKENPNENINFIISNDRYDYQYTIKNYYILRPKQNESYIVNKTNLIENIKIEEKILSEITCQPEYITFILSILGDKQRNIEKLKRIGLSTILKMINKALELNIIGNDVYNINILINILKPIYKETLLNNYYCTDLDTQAKMLNIKDTYNITSQLKDKFDNLSLKKLNDRYFSLFPLYLLELTSGEKLNTTKQKKKNIFL